MTINQQLASQVPCILYKNKAYRCALPLHQRNSQFKKHNFSLYTYKRITTLQNEVKNKHCLNNINNNLTYLSQRKRYKPQCQ